jgi:PUA-domain protein
MTIRRNSMRHLKDRELKQLVKEFVNQFPSSTESLHSVKHLEEEIIEGNLVFFTDGKPWIVRIQGRLLPSLKYDQVLFTLPKIVVDMGAVPHVANGAHIMRPGIRHIEGQFDKDGVVAILDEKYRKIIALGIAEQNSESTQSATKGRVITNIHYVGDPLWKSFTLSNRPKTD